MRVGVPTEGVRGVWMCRWRGDVAWPLHKAEGARRQKTVADRDVHGRGRAGGEEAWHGPLWRYNMRKVRGGENVCHVRCGWA